MKNDTRKKTENQECFTFPKANVELHSQISKRELVLTVFEGEDCDLTGFNKGDFALYYPTTEIDENQIMVFKLTKDKCFRFGFLYENFNEIGVASVSHWQAISYKKKEISIVGVIVAVIKPYDACKTDAFHYEIETKSEEITVVCDGCKRQLTGTPEFIKSEGWDLRNGKTECLNCDLFGGEK